MGAQPELTEFPGKVAADKASGDMAKGDTAGLFGPPVMGAHLELTTPPPDKATGDTATGDTASGDKADLLGLSAIGDTTNGTRTRTNTIPYDTKANAPG